MEKYRVYLVDDDRDDLELLQEAFQESGCAKEVWLLDSMDELFAKLNEEPILPDLVVLDNQTPGTNGSEALTLLRSNEKYNEITVAVYSTYVNPFKQKELLQKGADACFAKGYTMDEITKHVKLFCEAVEKRKKENNNP